MGSSANTVCAFTTNLPKNPLVSFLLFCFGLSLPEKVPVSQSATDPTFETKSRAQKSFSYGALEIQRQTA